MKTARDRRQQACALLWDARGKPVTYEELKEKIGLTLADLQTLYKDGRAVYIGRSGKTVILAAPEFADIKRR